MDRKLTVAGLAAIALARLDAWANYERMRRVYPGRAANKASVGRAQRYKGGDKYAGRVHRQDGPAARRRRQMARLVAGGDPQPRGVGAIRPKPRSAKTAEIARAHRGR